MASLQRRVFYAWHPPDTTTDKEAVVRFRIHRNGKLSDLKLVSKSNSPFAQSALQAIQDAAPFYPLPPGAPEDVEIQFTFPIEFKIMTGFKPSEYKIVPYSKRQIANFDYLRFRLAPYLMTMQKTILDKWSESGAYKTKAIISFTMNAEGKLSDFAAAHAEIPSNQAMYDLVKQSSPIDLPPGLPGEIRIKFAFEIKNPYILEAQLLRP
ncbi:TonB C-terminal domain-containing protein [bacterium]|nr:TonB C-terminal domain-containing protein [bacterium]